MEIWDLHCHLHGVPGNTPEARLGKLLEYAVCMGISCLCVLMGMDWSYDPSPEKMRQENDEVLRALRHFPDRPFGFVYLNPKHTQASLDELNRCVRDGPMVGVKLWVAQHCNAPELDPIVERAAELKAIVFQHTWLKITGNLPGESTSMELAELAARHPGAAILCGHSGGDWERGLRAIRGENARQLCVASRRPPSEGTRPATPGRPGPLTRRRAFKSSCIAGVSRPI
jgi:hypothetical protein